MMRLINLSVMSADKQYRQQVNKIFRQMTDDSLAPDGGRNYLAALNILQTLPRGVGYPESLWLQANAPFNHHEIIYPPPAKAVSKKVFAAGRI